MILFRFQSFRFHQYHDIVSFYRKRSLNQVLEDCCLFLPELFSDFHGSWQNHTGLNAPLYRRFNEPESDITLNQVSLGESSKAIKPILFHRILVFIYG